MQVHAPLLERHRVFQSRDADETRAFLRTKEFRFEVPARRARDVDVRINGVYLPNAYLGYIQYGSPVEIRATPARSDYWIQLSVRGHLQMWARTAWRAMPAGGGLVTDPRDRHALGRRERQD